MFSKLFGRNSARTNDGGRDAGTHDGGGDERRRSPALDQALVAVEARYGAEGLNILDLGAAHGTTLEAFGGRGHRIHVTDLLGGLRRDGAGLGGEAVRETFETRARELMPATKKPGFDLALAWDVPDYLPTTTLPALFQLVARRVREGGYLVFQVGYRQKMPAQPRIQEVMDDLSLLVRGGEEARQVECPRHRETQLARAADPFKVERSFLCKNGLMEYMMVRGSAAWGDSSKS